MKFKRRLSLLRNEKKKRSLEERLNGTFYGRTAIGYKPGQKLVSRDGRKYEVAKDGSFRRVEIASH